MVAWRDRRGIIDERADGSQHEALRKIVHGDSTEPGATHFFVYKARTGRVQVPGLVEMQGTPITDPTAATSARPPPRCATGSRLGPPDFVSMFAMWAVMMLRMMVPTALPMTLVYAVIARKAANQGTPVAPTSAFVAGYIAMWTAFSAAATWFAWQGLA